MSGASSAGGGAGCGLRLGLGLRLAALQPGEAGEQVAARAVAGWVGVEHDAAAERVGRRERADHHAVAARGHERLLEAQLEVAAAELGQPGRRLARAVVHGDSRAAVGPRVGRGPGERDVDAEARRQLLPGHHDVSAAHLVAADAGQVERHPLARLGALARLVVDLDGADARRGARGQDADLVAARRRALPQRAGDDRAGAADRERAVDVQAQRAVGAAARDPRGRRGPARRGARRAPRRRAPRPGRPRRRAAAPPPPRTRARDRRDRPS